MSSSIESGARAEEIAKQFLQSLGLIFLRSNFRCKMGEIDLVFQDKDERVIVEVRSRKQTSFGDGAETVFYQKQKKLIRTTKYYQQTEQYWGNIRFDVISIVVADNAAPVITHIPDAFMDEG
ncbi:MAG: YraN family protein [bacterium]|nr:YraN family protein [bacterium]